MEKIFFFRSSDDDGYQKYINKYQKILNKNTLNNFWTPFKKLYNFDEYDHYKRYVFELIKEWMDKEEVYSFSYITNVKRLFHCYGLEKELNNFEKTYIYDVENLVFDKERNLKSIPVEFSVKKNIKKFRGKNESIFFQFDDVKFSIEDSQIKQRCSLYLGETKLFLLVQPDLMTINYKDITDHRIRFPDEIYIKAHDKQMVIYSKEIKNIYSAFERVYYANK